MRFRTDGAKKWFGLAVQSFARAAGPWLAREYWDELRAEAEGGAFLKPALFRRAGENGWRRVSYRELAPALGLGHERTVRRLFAGELAWIRMQTLNGLRDAQAAARDVATGLEAAAHRIEKAVALGSAERERRDARVRFYQSEAKAVMRAADQLGRHIDADLTIPSAEAVDAGQEHSRRVLDRLTPADEMRLWQRIDRCSDFNELRRLYRRILRLREARDGRLGRSQRPPRSIHRGAAEVALK